MNCLGGPRVKICGITNIEDALAAVDAGADALGFVLAPEAKARKRHIELDDAAAIVDALPAFVTTVAVCVNESAERLDDILRVVDRVQLCGDESPAFCARFGPRAIKAFRAGPDFRTVSMRAYATAAWLLDAWAPDSHGGTGRTCDWTVAAEAVALGRPLILAGGLTPANVADAVARVRPYAVDVSGGVESDPGKKDHDKLREFVCNARRALSVSG